MKWLRTVAREVYGLFVDDAGFTVALLVLLGAMGLAVMQGPRVHLQIPGWLAALMLFASLAATLLVSALRFARDKMKHKAQTTTQITTQTETQQ